MTFKSKQITKNYKQINTNIPEKVFPLLCPVREKDWLDGWEYEMIYSTSGLAEKGCVFLTSHNGKDDIWYITEHDKEKGKIEFIRMTPGEMVVKINIDLFDNKDGTTTTDISYQYTTLSESQNEWIEKDLDKYFTHMMIWWEKAANYYLQTGKILLK